MKLTKINVAERVMLPLYAFNCTYWDMFVSCFAVTDSDTQIGRVIAITWQELWLA